MNYDTDVFRLRIVDQRSPANAVESGKYSAEYPQASMRAMAEGQTGGEFFRRLP
jgi:hypothetical protein